VTGDRISVKVSEGVAVSAILTAAQDQGWLFAYAPGAGSNVNDPFAIHAAGQLAALGIGVIRFQFPYQEAGRGGPNPNPVLEATWRAVVGRAQEVAGPGTRLVVGGRSMGGRIASHIVAAGEPVDALALFAYPLHSPGRLDQKRDAHLPSIAVPTLFCSGTRDAFGSPDELKQAAAMVPGARLHLLEGADHGFSVPKSSGRKREDVWTEACDALIEFLATLG
jgi:predicted alpha/beta-hydrolase family hydrolase